MTDENPKTPFDNFGEDPTGKPEDRKTGGHPETNSPPSPPLSAQEKDTIRRLASEGKGVNEIARELKRSPATVSRAFKKMNLAKAIALNKAQRFLDEKLTARQVMEKITQKADAILSKFQNLDEETVKKNGWLILKACSELRHIVETELRICETLYNAEAVAKWQELLLTILGKVAPDARDEFYRQYEAARPIR